MPALTAAAVLLLFAAGAASLRADDQPTRKRLPPALSARHAALTPPDTPEHSVSGFSSGADAAVIHQLAFSQRVVGAGILAGAPYGCQILPDCGNTCSGKNYTAQLANRVRPLVLLQLRAAARPRGRRGAAAALMRACCLLTFYVRQTFLPLLLQYATNRSRRGLIDDLAHLTGRRVFVFSGKQVHILIPPTALRVTSSSKSLLLTQGCALRQDNIVWTEAMVALKDQLVALGADVKANLGQLHSVHSWLLDEYDCNRPTSAHDNGTPMCCGKKEGETVCPPPNGSLPEPLGPQPPPPPPLPPCAAGDAFCMATVRSCSQGGSVRCGDVDLDASLDFAHYGMVKGNPQDAEVKAGAALAIGPAVVVDAAGAPVAGGAKCYANNPTTFSTAHGSPTRRVTKDGHGIFTSPADQAFRVNLTLPPALDDAAYVVRFYVGLYNSGGTFSAWTPWSGKTRLSYSLPQPAAATTNFVITLNVSSAGGALTAEWRHGKGNNIQLQAITVAKAQMVHGAVSLPSWQLPPQRPTLPPVTAACSAGGAGCGCCGSCLSGQTRVWKNGTGGWRPPMNHGHCVAGRSVGWDMTGNFWRHIYGNASIAPRETPSRVDANRLLLFNQSRYVPTEANWTLFESGLSSTGFVYVPRRCFGDALTNGTCRFHVHYHPCGGSFRFVGVSYMLQNGMAAYGESSNIVTLHPQASRRGIYGANCWDWCGKTSADFDTRGGLQLNMVLRMLADVKNIVAEGGARGWKSDDVPSSVLRAATLMSVSSLASSSPWGKVPAAWCYEGDRFPKNYASRSSAEAACLALRKNGSSSRYPSSMCTGIYDRHCKGKRLYVCHSQGFHRSGTGSCVRTAPLSVCRAGSAGESSLTTPSQCKACTMGKWSKASATFCTVCPDGTTSPSGSTDPNSCRLATAAAQKAQTMALTDLKRVAAKCLGAVAVRDLCGFGNCSLLSQSDCQSNSGITADCCPNNFITCYGGRVTMIQLTDCGMMELPASIGNLHALTALWLGYNQIPSIPDSVTRLKYLIDLDMKYNRLTQLPFGFGSLKALKRCNFGYNQIRTLPQSIGNLDGMIYWRLENNFLETLPTSIGSVGGGRGGAFSALLLE